MAFGLLKKRSMNITDTFKTTPAKTIRNLIQILHDGQAGFQQAAVNVANPQLKDLFSRFSLQRAKFAGELESELRALGEKDYQNEGTTVSGALHRGWIDLKTAFARGDDHAVLAEAERGEDAAKKAYQDALVQENLPEPVLRVIVSQAAEIQATHDEVKALRDASKR